MKILITNTTLAGRTGTEVLTLNLARALHALGHEPTVYSPLLGPIATEIRSLGIPVTDDISTLTETPDIIHGHHSIETATAALRFSQTPALFVCHDFIAWHDEAPVLPNIQAYVAISQGFSKRLTQQDGISPEFVHIIPNSIDTARFQPGPDLPETPRRALAFAKNDGHIAAITTACKKRNIELDIIGLAVNNVVASPETIMGDYDIVFASGLSALEALSCGRAVITCDGRGLAGMVTEENFDQFRIENFGLPVFNLPLTNEHVLQQIDLYNPAQSQIIQQRIHNEANLQTWAENYVALYQSLIDNFKAPDTTDTGRAAAAFLQRWTPARSPFSVLAERDGFKARIEELSQGLQKLPVKHYIPANSQNYMTLCGFHPVEPWGAWSAKSNFSIRLRPSESFRKLTLTVIPIITPQRPYAPITVSINNMPLGTRLLGAGRQEQTFEIPQLGDDTVWIEIISDKGDYPVSQDGNVDSRLIGLGLINLRLD